MINIFFNLYSSVEYAECNKQFCLIFWGSYDIYLSIKKISS